MSKKSIVILFFVCVCILQNANLPGMDLTGEIWVETKASEGKSYFYNARTRETTWTKPEGPAVKIITQEQVVFYKFIMHLLYFCKEKTSM
jgi:hypothetical protein